MAHNFDNFQSSIIHEFGHAVCLNGHPDCDEFYFKFLPEEKHWITASNVRLESISDELFFATFYAAGALAEYVAHHADLDLKSLEIQLNHDYRTSPATVFSSPHNLDDLSRLVPLLQTFSGEQHLALYQQLAGLLMPLNNIVSSINPDTLDKFGSLLEAISPRVLIIGSGREFTKLIENQPYQYRVNGQPETADGLC